MLTLTQEYYIKNLNATEYDANLEFYALRGPLQYKRKSEMSRGRRGRIKLEGYTAGTFSNWTLRETHGLMNLRFVICR